MSNTQKTPIKKNSIAKNAIKYSFKLNWMLFQLIKIHKGISNVVSNKKNNEIPSIPKVMFKFSTGTHKIFVINWKLPTDFLNPPQRKTKIKR